VNRARFEHMSRLPQRSNTEPLRPAAAWQRSGATLRCTGRCSASPRYQQPLEAGRRYLHRGTSGDVSANVHRRPRKSVVTEVRWCTPHANPHECERPRYIPAPRHFGVRKWWELPVLTDTGLGPSNAASQCCPAAAGRGEHHVDRTSAGAGVVMDVEMGRKLADIQ